LKRILKKNNKKSFKKFWIIHLLQLRIYGYYLKDFFLNGEENMTIPSSLNHLIKTNQILLNGRLNIKLSDEDIISYELTSFLGHKSLLPDKTLYFLEQTFDGKKRNIVAHADLSAKPVMFPEKGEAYVLLKKFISYSDWCDKNNLQFDLFNIKTRQAPGHHSERVWLDTGHELLKMGGVHAPVNGFGILLRGKHLEFVNLCGLRLEGELYFGSEGNLDLSYCSVDHLTCTNLNFPGMWLRYCSLKDFKASNSEISHWKFWQCDLEGDIIDSKLRVIRILGGSFTPYIKDCQLYKVEADHHGLPHSGFNYTYSLLKKIFDSQGDDDEAARYYVKEKELGRERSKGWRYALKTLSYYYWQYGKKPQNVIYISIATILICGFIYWLFPGNVKPVDESKDLLDSIYFSTVTFTTLGYGDLSPVGWLRIISLFEAFFGALNIGFLVAGFSRAKY
jgi:hypothetical protein